MRPPVGRAIVRMPVVKIYQGPVDDAELDAIVAAARAEAEAASAAWD
jgi:hypothetical protein